MKKQVVVTNPNAPAALMTREQAAGYLQCSTRAISDWQRKRMLPHVRLAAKCVRFRKSDLDAVIDRMTVRAAGV